MQSKYHLLLLVRTDSVGLDLMRNGTSRNFTKVQIGVYNAPAMNRRCVLSIQTHNTSTPWLQTYATPIASWWHVVLRRTVTAFVVYTLYPIRALLRETTKRLRAAHPVDASTCHHHCHPTEHAGCCEACAYLILCKIFLSGAEDLAVEHCSHHGN